MKKEGKIRVYLLIGVVIFIIVIVSIVAHNAGRQSIPDGMPESLWEAKLLSEEKLEEILNTDVDPEDIYLIQYDGDGGERYIYINFKGKNYGLNNNAESDNKIIQKVIDAIDGGYNALDD